MDDLNSSSHIPIIPAIHAPQQSRGREKRRRPSEETYSEKEQRHHETEKESATKTIVTTEEDASIKGVNVDIQV